MVENGIKRMQEPCRLLEDERPFRDPCFSMETRLIKRTINVGKIWKLLYCFYALMCIPEKILIMGFIERSWSRVDLECKGPFECKLFQFC